MNSRIHGLDYVRVLAIFVIVMCHFLEFSGINLGLGRYFGRVGNMVFFLLSALLYGAKLQSITGGGNFIDVRKFVVGRLLKLGSSVWPFIVCLSALYITSDIKFSWFNVGMNFVFLGYIWKLPGQEHLWFLTVMMACYLEYIFFAKLQIKNKSFPWIFLAVMCLALVFFEKMGVPGSSLAILGFFGFLLLKADWFTRIAKSMSMWSCFIVFLFNVVCAWLFVNGLFEYSRIIAYLLSNVCGCLLFALLIRVAPMHKDSIVAWLSGISFEIYLVHHTLCAGPFVKITLWNCNASLRFVILVLVSLLLAQILHMISNLMSSVFKLFLIK